MVDMPEPSWTDGNGTTLLLSEMSESHIRNCMKMLSRSNSERDKRKLEAFRSELSERETIKRQMAQIRRP